MAGPYQHDDWRRPERGEQHEAATSTQNQFQYTAQASFSPIANDRHAISHHSWVRDGNNARRSGLGGGPPVICDARDAQPRIPKPFNSAEAKQAGRIEQETQGSAEVRRWPSKAQSVREILISIPLPTNHFDTVCSGKTLETTEAQKKWSGRWPTRHQVWRSH